MTVCVHRIHSAHRKPMRSERTPVVNASITLSNYILLLNKWYIFKYAPEKCIAIAVVSGARLCCADWWMIQRERARTTISPGIISIWITLLKTDVFQSCCWCCFFFFLLFFYIRFANAVWFNLLFKHFRSNVNKPHLSCYLTISLLHQSLQSVFCSRLLVSHYFVCWMWIFGIFFNATIAAAVELLNCS